MISSFFITLTPHKGIDGVSPSKEQLAMIAATTSDSAKTILKLDPKLALLSFSTRGSAQNLHVKKIERAGDILRELKPNLPVESAIQFDAAIDKDVALIKAPHSQVAGQANILIFPDLNSGNIDYKIAEHIGGAKAIGPIFQGLKKPANDLSRGCDVDAVYNMIAVTVLQAQAALDKASNA